MARLARLAESGDDLTAPRLLREEVSNALLTGIRRQRWSGAEADRAYRRLRAPPIRFVDDLRDLHRAWDLSRRYDNHPVYGMLYVALNATALCAQRPADLVFANHVLRARHSRRGAPAPSG